MFLFILAYVVHRDSSHWVFPDSLSSWSEAKLYGTCGPSGSWPEGPAEPGHCTVAACWGEVKGVLEESF